MINKLRQDVYLNTLSNPQCIGVPDLKSAMHWVIRSQICNTLGYSISYLHCIGCPISKPQCIGVSDLKSLIHWLFDLKSAIHYGILSQICIALGSDLKSAMHSGIRSQIRNALEYMISNPQCFGVPVSDLKSTMHWGIRSQIRNKLGLIIVTYGFKWTLIETLLNAWT